MRTIIIAALLGSVAAGGVAVAQTAAAPVVKPLRGDLNADGKLSRSEFVKQAEAKFTALDTNRDGSLTHDEARPGGDRMAGRGGKHGRFGAMAQDGASPPAAGGATRAPGGGMARQDSDGDGKVSRAEFDAETAKRFARMDTNGDGTVDKTEMAALPGGGRMGSRADTDGSGTLTRAEYTAQSAQRFARMDTNADGVIDAAEMQARPMGRGGAGRPAAPTPPAPTGA